jgi:hypothetical protein
MQNALPKSNKPSLFFIDVKICGCTMALFVLRLKSSTADVDYY